jgi:RadC-like JAB domain
LDLVHVERLVRGMTEGLPVEVAFVVPRRSHAWGEPVVVRLGTADSVGARPGPVLRAVLISGAEAFVLVHTHLSRRPPGEDDAAATRRLVAAAAVVGVPLLGHVVVGPDAAWQCDSRGAWRVVPAVPTAAR